MGNIAQIIAAFTAFVHSLTGKPEVLPPQPQIQFENRGSQISQLAQTLRLMHQSGPTGVTGTANQQGPSGVTGETGPSGASGVSAATGAQGPTGPTGASGFRHPRIEAVNLRSGMTMPHLLPQNAVDNSQALDTPDPLNPLPTPPGQNNGSHGNSNGNSSVNSQTGTRGNRNTTIIQ
jgi:hypothetical protein